jgi:hypothetical protein
MTNQHLEKSSELMRGIEQASIAAGENARLIASPMRCYNAGKLTAALVVGVNARTNTTRVVGSICQLCAPDKHQVTAQSVNLCSQIYGDAHCLAYHEL